MSALGLAKPCIDCGTPTTNGNRCPADQTVANRRPYERRREREAEYNRRAWRRLSATARRLQPWCTDCGTRSNLTAHHTEQAWARRLAGKTIRLQDVEVLCLRCNDRRGQTRPSVARATVGGCCT